MRTTVRLREDLLRRAKKRAAEEHRTLTSLLEEALVLVLAKPKTKAGGLIRLKVSRASGGVLPGVDLNRSAELEEVMEDR